MENKLNAQNQIYTHTYEDVRNAALEASKNIKDTFLEHLKLCTYVPPVKIDTKTFESKMDFMLKITGCNTKEDLIRYIVCDGEPADESCVGHPVLVSMAWDESWQDYVSDGYIYVGKDREWFTVTVKSLGIKQNWSFAKKKPGYDYTRKAE